MHHFVFTQLRDFGIGSQSAKDYIMESNRKTHEKLCHANCSKATHSMWLVDVFREKKLIEEREIFPVGDPTRSFPVSKLSVH